MPCRPRAGLPKLMARVRRRPAVVLSSSVVQAVGSSLSWDNSQQMGEHVLRLSIQHVHANNCTTLGSRLPFFIEGRRWNEPQQTARQAERLSEVDPVSSYLYDKRATNFLPCMAPLHQEERDMISWCDMANRNERMLCLVQELRF